MYAACKNPQVAACVVFYGGHPNVKPELARLQAPMLGIYAEKDGFVTVDSVRELERQLKSLGKQAEIHIYPGVDHAFFNDTRPEVYDPAASADAWERTLEWFRRYLV